MIYTLHAATSILLALSLGPSQPNIYQCLDSQDIPRFTDRGCLDGPKLVLSPTNIIPTDISHKKELAPLTRPKARKRLDQPNSYAAKRDACQDAKRGLQELRDRRRRGYRLNETRSLNKREKALVELRRENC